MIYELRTYYAAPGKMDALNKRFRDHTCDIFERHGMTVVGFWTPEGEEDKTLVYMLGSSRPAFQPTESSLSF